MAWLIVCPHHKTGVFGLIFFFFILIYQPTLHGLNEQVDYLKKKSSFLIFFKSSKFSFFNNTSLFNSDVNFFHQISYGFFLMCFFYTTTFLPYGRFYNRIGGNIGMLGSYFYVFSWLTFHWLRKPLTLELKLIDVLWAPTNLSRYVF